MINPVQSKLGSPPTHGTNFPGSVSTSPPMIGLVGLKVLPPDGLDFDAVELVAPVTLGVVPPGAVTFEVVPPDPVELVVPAELVAPGELEIVAPGPVVLVVSAWTSVNPSVLVDPGVVVSSVSNTISSSSSF